MTHNCPVCDSAYIGGTEGNYSQCPQCDSYIYFSNNSSEFDNKHFYNEFYDCTNGYRRSRLKRKIFSLFRNKNQILNAHDYLQQREMQESIYRLFHGPGKLVEIGFGEGRTLEALIRQGVDAYGIDISEKAVNSFKQRNPKYQDRVAVGTRMGQLADILYCSALLEHIDDPSMFIQDASVNLKREGIIIVDALPILNENEPSIVLKDDISFWKPCHRIIYSRRGIEFLFKRNGYSLEKFIMVDAYVYRVLSLHLQNNYIEMIRLRSPCLSGGNLPGLLKFYSLCREALKSKSMAIAGRFVFKKN